jgi:hypothetical protein
MTDWKPIDSAPRDGGKVLLFATLKVMPEDAPGPFVGFWDDFVKKWKVAHALFSIHELIPSWWAEIGEPPRQPS